MRVALLALIGLCMIQSVQADESPAVAGHLRCEYRHNPLGIGVTQPRLSWEMHDARRGAKQTAYQVLVASTPEKLAAQVGDLWDSGRVASDQSTQVVYAGKPLGSRTACHWKVRLWDADGSPTRYTKPALWTVGLLEPSDIKAQWIGVHGPMYPGAAAEMKGPTFDKCVWIWAAEPGVNAREKAPAGTRYFRRSLWLPPDRPLRRVQFLIAVDDSMELFVNGKPAGAGAGFGTRNWSISRSICTAATIPWPWR